MFSGILAPELAMPWVDWKWCAEIEKFPRVVIKHRHRGIPNLGDVTSETFIERARELGPIDILVFGSPCQGFSVAGKRLGMDDPRGNLALVALGIIAALRPRWFLFENVPGLFSSWSGGPAGTPTVEGIVKGGGYREFLESSDFASFLSAVRDIRYFGAYRTLDAQFFGVPQRRRRIFFVGNTRDWRHSAAVLFESESLPRNPSPRRKEREAVTGSLAARTRGGGGLGTDFDLDGGLLAKCLNAKGGAGRSDGESETFIAAFQNTGQGWWKQSDQAQSLRSASGGGTQEANVIAHSLRADGFDASEDGTGRGTPLVAVAFQSKASASQTMNASQISPSIDVGKSDGLAICFDTTQITSKTNRSNPQVGDPCHPLAAGAHPPALAFSCKDHGSDAGEIAPTLCGMGHDGSHANAGGQVAIAFQSSQSGVRVRDTHATLDGNNGPRRRNGIIQDMAVRRLTPIEAARLQGFPDTFCHIYRRKKRKITPETAAYYKSHGLKCFLREGQWFTFIAADGPIYKAYGNSMAIPVLRWIGNRIRAVNVIVESPSSTSTSTTQEIKKATAAKR